MEQGQHQRHFTAWNLTLVLSALTKPPFELLDQARISYLHGRQFTSSRLLPANVGVKSMLSNMPDYNEPQAEHR